MKTLCDLQLDPLIQLLDSAGQSGKIVRNTTTDPVLYLDRLSAIYRYISTNKKTYCGFILGARHFSLIIFMIEKCVYFDTRIDIFFRKGEQKIFPVSSSG